MSSYFCWLDVLNIRWPCIFGFVFAKQYQHVSMNWMPCVLSWAAWVEVDGGGGTMPALRLLLSPSWLLAQPCQIVLPSSLSASPPPQDNRRVDRLLGPARTLGTQGFWRQCGQWPETMAGPWELFPWPGPQTSLSFAQSQASLPSTSLLALSGSRALSQPCQHHLAVGEQAPQLSHPLCHLPFPRSCWIKGFLW